MCDANDIFKNLLNDKLPPLNIPTNGTTNSNNDLSSEQRGMSSASFGLQNVSESANTTGNNDN